MANELETLASPPIRLDQPHLPPLDVVKERLATAVPAPRMIFHRFREMANLFEKIDGTFRTMSDICRSEQDSAEKLCEAFAELRRHDFSKTPEWDKHSNDGKLWRVLIIRTPEDWEPNGLSDIPPGICPEMVTGSWGEYENSYKAMCFAAGWNVLHLQDIAQGARFKKHNAWAMIVPFDSPLKKEPAKPPVESPREYYSAQVNRPEGWRPTSASDNPPELLQVLFWEDMLYESEENTLEGAMETAIASNERALEDLREAEDRNEEDVLRYWHVVLRIPGSDRDDGSFVFHPGESTGILTVHRLFKPEWIKFAPTAFVK